MSVLAPMQQRRPSVEDYLAAIGLDVFTEWFDLVLDPLTILNASSIAANATVYPTITIAADSHLVVEKWMHDTSPSDSTGVWAIKVNDGGNDRDLSNRPVRRDNFAGTALRPALIKPKLFKAKSTLTFTITGGTAAITILQIVGRGYKILNLDALNRTQG